MTGVNRILHYFVLPIIGALMLPPDWLSGGIIAVLLVMLLFIGLGLLLLRGRSAALSLVIFIMGFNVIIRLMMFYPHITNVDGSADVPFILTSIISLALSLYLVIRLDKVDVRVQMIR